MELVAWLLFIVQILVVLAVFSTWIRVKEIEERQRKTEEMLLDIQWRMRRLVPPASEPLPEHPVKTCIRCLTTVPRKASKCPSCGHFFDLA